MFAKGYDRVNSEVNHEDRRNSGQNVYELIRTA